MEMRTAVLVQVLLLCHLQPLMSSRLITPPPGNSIAIKAITLDGKLEYVCEKAGGKWLLLQKRATLMDQTNHTKVIGFYTSNHKLSSFSRHAGTWTLINNEADKAESGHPTSLVSGNKLVTIGRGQDKLPEFLAQASLHRNEGAARRVSYIVQLNAELLASPPLSNCESASKVTISIGFKAEYTFWRQDFLPPKVPQSLSVPSQHHVVQGFFAQGIIKFNYDHKFQLWRKHKVLAKLYDVPGGVQVGGFSYNISTTILGNSSHQQNASNVACIIINNPNGFKVCGRQENTTTTSPHQTSFPWSLFHLTSNFGNITQIWGPFTFAQMVSTWGGLPPQTLNDTSIATTFHVWKSHFTAIIWLYTSRVA